MNPKAKSPVKRDDELQDELRTERDAQAQVDTCDLAYMLHLHHQQERNQQNRARAIRIHGTVCKACGFDFNRVYGAEFAHSFIELHCTLPLSAEELEVNPETDLVPLCSNCHHMAHRISGRVLSVEELKEVIARAAETR